MFRKVKNMASGMLKFANSIKKECSEDAAIQVHPDVEMYNDVNKYEQVVNTPIQVDKDTLNPTKCWQKLRVKQKKTKQVTTIPLDTPVYEDKIRFVCMSDTHSRTNRLPPEWIPHGDVFLHAGDFTNVGKIKEIEEFNNFLGSLPHRHKIVIAGNHELTFDEYFLHGAGCGYLNSFGVDAYAVKATLKEKGLEKASQILTNCTYLQDSEVSVAGIRIYGSPWQPEYCGWGFNLIRGQELLEKWNKIQEGIDILITHGPPVGYGDATHDGIRAGCVELLNTIQKRVKPKYHLFGHIHEAYGVTSDGFTTFINASSCTLRYFPSNPPIIFDIPLPQGYTKEDISDIQFPPQIDVNSLNMKTNVKEMNALAGYTDVQDSEQIMLPDPKHISDTDSESSNIVFLEEDSEDM